MTASPASAEAGCDHGEASTTLVIPHSSNWYNNTDAWRVRVTSQPFGWYTRLVAYGARQWNGTEYWDPEIYNQQFQSVGGMWSNGNHFSEVAQRHRIYNGIGNSHQYYYERSCMK